jgi:hypothetical protein
VIEEIAFGDCSEEERDSVVIHRGAPLSHRAVDYIKYVEGISAGRIEVWSIARVWGHKCRRGC